MRAILARGLLAPLAGQNFNVSFRIVKAVKFKATAPLKGVLGKDRIGYSGSGPSNKDAHMSISSISKIGVGSAPPAPPAQAPAKPAVAAAPAPAPAAKVDADGDHDGSVGTKLNVKA